MNMKQQKTGNFLLSTLAICSAILFIFFSSHAGTASSGISDKKGYGFYSATGIGNSVVLASTPVKIPSPAVFTKKGNSSRISITSKYIQLVPQVLWENYSVFCESGKSLLKVPPTRLHLSLRVMRI